MIIADVSQVLCKVFLNVGDFSRVIRLIQPGDALVITRGQWSKNV